MVDSDKVYIQVVRPRIAWVKPLGYEVNIDETKDIIEALINEPIDPKAPYFGTYEEAKTRIELSIKLPQAVNKGRKRMAKMQTSTPLMLTEGKGEDIAKEEEVEESEEESSPVKKKGKVTITKAPKAPKTVVFTKKKGKAGKGEVVFKKPSLTFEEHIKKFIEGSRMANFRSLKYEIRTEAKQKEIEDAIMEKMGQWKYSLDEMASQIPKTLLDKVRIRWENAKQTAKDIFSQNAKFEEC